MALPMAAFLRSYPTGDAKQALPGGQVQIPLLASLKNSVRWEVDEKWVGKPLSTVPRQAKASKGSGFWQKP